MITTLRSATTEVCIDFERPFVVIGEKINPTGRKKLAAALQEGNLDYAVELAVSQAAAGADVMDVNVGVPGLDDVAVLPELIKRVTQAVKTPICIDTPNAEALAAALKIVPGKPLVNSVNGEERSLSSVLPLVAERGAAVIGLVMDENGIPPTAEARLVVADKIISRAAQVGIPIENVIIDPLVLTVGADHRAASITLDTISLVRKEFGVNMTLGASNVSFGLPDRHTINQAFLALAINRGATCAITDPMKLTSIARAADLLLGRDAYAKRYVTYFRQHPPEAK